MTEDLFLFTQEDPKPHSLFAISPYTYADGAPTFFIDPLGLFTVCCDAWDKEELPKLLDGAIWYWNRYNFGQSLPDTAKPAAMGLCASEFALLPGNRPGRWRRNVYRPPDMIDPPKGACGSACLRHHEAIHRKQCEALGPVTPGEVMSTEGAAFEVPAYRAEINCLRTAIQNNSVDTKVFFP